MKLRYPSSKGASARSPGAPGTTVPVRGFEAALSCSSGVGFMQARSKPTLVPKLLGLRRCPFPQRIERCPVPTSAIGAPWRHPSVHLREASAQSL